MALSGTNFVRFSRHGLQSIRRYWGSISDRFEVRRQALKLKWWDERHEHPAGVLVDLTYESIKALSGLSIYELRIDDEIGGQANIRVIFFDPPSSWQLLPGEARPMRVVWALEAMPKRRQEWTQNDITRFRAARLVIAKRFYDQ